MSSIVLTRFAKGRLFPKDGRPNAIVGATAESFTEQCNQLTPVAVLPGYAPFCRLQVYPNFTQTRCLTTPITPDNQHQLRSAYEARTPSELPVLVRWFEGLTPPIAAYLVVILYSREQLAKEGDKIKGDWGIVGCLATLTPEEIPMTPITMLRNALGVEEGGSGVPIDREAYAKSVAYWAAHANWR